MLLRLDMSVSFARVLVCLVLGGIGAYAGARYAQYLNWDASIPAAPSSTRAEIQLPDPRLSPADVVRLQVNALRAFRNDESAISQCYVLASPANRAVTGPLGRFIAMVQNPQYRPLVAQSSALFGQPVIRGGQATVLVTVLDHSRTAHVFRFFLSKQTDPLYLDCWMTDAVIPAWGQVQEQDPAPSPVTAA
jgi:hypothetical protein